MSTNGRKKIGVFVCHCGINIAGVVDVKEVSEEMASYPDVSFSTDYVYMCSEPGQAKILEMANKKNLNAIVVAACSPKLHEATFRNAVQEVGINAYHVEIANIREQCSWVHSQDNERATRKALEIIKTIVEKLRLDQALQPILCAVNRKALVLGGGISGMQAALDIADRGHMVTLVERESYIGGHLVDLSRTFLTHDRSEDLLGRISARVYSHPKIELLTCSEVRAVDGYLGNFTATIHRKAWFVRWDACDGCGLCVESCPVTVPFGQQKPHTKNRAIFLTPTMTIPQKAVIDKSICLHFKEGCDACEKACPNHAIKFQQREVKLRRDAGAIIVATGFDLYKKQNIPEYLGGRCPDVLDGLEFERILSAYTPGNEPLRRPSDGKIPKTVAFVQCARSRDPDHGMPYCSSICCKYTVKQASLYKQAVPDGQAVVFYIDVRTAGKHCDEYYQDAVSDEGLLFIRGKVSKIFREGDEIVLWAADTLTGNQVEISCDLVVLATAVTPRTGAMNVAQTLNIPTDAHGFFQEIHPKLRPVESPTLGIYLAGCARGPLDIPESITYASGAASKVMALFAREEISHEPIVAYVDAEMCVGCGLCVTACPYGARILNERTQTAEVIEVMCQGCGGCVAACPNGATHQHNFDAEQFMHMVDAAL